MQYTLISEKYRTDRKRKGDFGMSELSSIKSQALTERIE